MKTQLTVEQSANLISKGVSADKASATHVGRWEHYSTGTFADPESVEPIFTLADLLEILPKEIEDYTLRIDTNKDNWEVEYSIISNKDWNPLYFVENDELIDALYELIIFCIDKNYLTKE